MMNIISSIAQLKHKDKTIIKTGDFYDLFDNELWFFYKEKMIIWTFQDSFVEVKELLDKLGIQYRNFTSEGNFEMNFERFYNSSFKERVLSNKEVYLFEDSLVFDWNNKVCFYSFPKTDINRLRTFLNINSITYKNYI